MRLKVPTFILLCLGIIAIILGIADYFYYKGAYSLPFETNWLDNINASIKNKFFPPAMYTSDKGDKLILDSPDLEKVNVCGLSFSGNAPSSWFFEGSFTIELLNEDGVLLQKIIAETSDDWMQEDEMLEFSAELICEDECPPVGHIIFVRENPSGAEQFTDQIKVPVRFDTDCDNDTKEIINLFWGNINLDPQLKHCDSTYPYTRTVSIDEDPRDYALQLLLEGPTEREVKRGCFTSIGKLTEVNSLQIVEGVAYVDLSEDVVKTDLSTCYKLMIVSQFENTLKQFYDISDVVITVNGSDDNPLNQKDD